MKLFSLKGESLNRTAPSLNLCILFLLSEQNSILRETLVEIPEQQEFSDMEGGKLLCSPLSILALIHVSRICPGRYMAENSLFITITSILQVFEISPATDGSGREIPVKSEFTSGFTLYVNALCH